MNWKPALLSVCCVIASSTALFSLENPFSTSTPDIAIAADCDTMLPDTVQVPICPGGTATLYPGPGFQCYEWSTGNISDSILVDMAGIYVVTVCYQDSCTDEIFYFVDEVQVEIPESAMFCEGNIPTISATPGFVSYLWSNGDTTQTIELPAEPGVYEYSVTATDDEGCVVSDATEIAVESIPVPVVKITGLPNCAGFVLPTEIEGLLLHWTLNGTSVNTISVSGEYCFTVQDLIYGCIGPGDCATVNLENGLDVDISGPVELCYGSEAVLCATPGYQEYTWDTGDDIDCITVDTSGIYCVTVTSEEGCTGSACVEVSQFPEIFLDLPDEAHVCGDMPISLCAGFGFDSFLWNTGETTSCITTNFMGTYCVTVTDANGCSYFKCVQVTTSPTVTLIDTVITHDSGSSDGSITPVFDTENPPISYQWSTEDTTPSIHNLSAGTYMLTVQDSFGCMYMFEFVVEMASAVFDPEYPGSLLRIANNPAGDYWEISKIQPGIDHIASLSLTSPEGKTVWESTFFNASITIPAKQLPPGVYYLLLKSGDRVIGTIPLVRTK